MGKKQFHTRLDDDTAAWVDEFREERDITQAEALRRLVRAGQQEYQRDDDGRERVKEQGVRHGLSERMMTFITAAVGAASGAFAVGVF